MHKVETFGTWSVRVSSIPFTKWSNPSTHCISNKLLQTFGKVHLDVQQLFQVVIDGLYFYVRNGIVFLDCFRCSKAVALSLYGSHIAEFHSRESIECRANNCKKTVNAASIQVQQFSHLKRLSLDTKRKIFQKPFYLRFFKFCKPKLDNSLFTRFCITKKFEICSFWQVAKTKCDSTLIFFAYAM